MSFSPRKLPVSVCIPVLNEAKNLPDCLDSLSDSFAEVIVVDSGSKDQTREIVRSRGMLILNFNWNGEFPKKRNWALRNHPFKSEWVLFLDADERITPEFIAELWSVIPTTQHAGFWLSFNNWFMGRKLAYGDRFRKLALIRLGLGEYEKLPENAWSRLDMEVHEHPVINGSIGEITARLEHYDYRGVGHYISKHNEYSNWEARRYDWLKNGANLEWEKLNDRQRFKYQHLSCWWFASFYFFMSYVIKLGFLDGRTGWWFALFKLRYFSDIRLKIKEASDQPSLKK